MPSYEELLSQIEKLSKLPKVDIEEKIHEKEAELGGLVSKEGAAQIVARELGLDISSERKKTELVNIMPGMKNVNVIGRIFNISKNIDFTRQDGSKGKVVNLFVADNSGQARLPLWNDQTKIVEEEMVKIGDVIQVENSFAKESIYGDIELSLGKFGAVRKINDIGEVASSVELMKKFTKTEGERQNIDSLVQGNFEIKSTVVSVLQSRFLFYVCPSCGSKLDQKENKFSCAEHGEVKPKPQLYLSAILDDGTANIRAIFFRNNAEQVAQATAEEISSMEEEKRLKFIEDRLLGKELLLLGRVRKRQIGEGLELLVNEIKPINLFEEIKRLSSSFDLPVDANG